MCNGCMPFQFPISSAYPFEMNKRVGVVHFIVDLSTLIFVCNGYIPQPRKNLKWTVQGLKFSGLIQRQQFLLVFLNFNNGYVGGLKTQHIWLINLLMNLILMRRLWCQQPILLRMSIPPCGFLLKMVARWKRTCTLPLWMPC